MSSKRIVLVDPLGDILFSGESVIAKGEDDCPETQRSASEADSGIYRAAEKVPVVEVADVEAAIETEAPTQRKRDGRAA